MPPKQATLTPSDDEPKGSKKDGKAPLQLNQDILRRCFHRHNEDTGLCYFLQSAPFKCTQMCPQYITWDVEIAHKYKPSPHKPPTHWNEIARQPKIASKSYTEVQATFEP